jgi:hypothetical protein
MTNTPGDPHALLRYPSGLVGRAGHHRL